MKWQNGRQGSGYLKKKIFEFWKMDCYLIKYPDDSFIPEHVDQVDGKKHYRLNIVINKPKSGGRFICDKTIINTGRIILFRQDKYKHSLTPVVGERLVLSLGVAV